VLGTGARRVRVGLPGALETRGEGRDEGASGGPLAYAVVAGDGRAPRASVSPGVAWAALRAVGRCPASRALRPPGGRGDGVLGVCALVGRRD